MRSRLDRANDISYLLFTVARGLGVSCLATLRLLRVVCCCGCSDLALILFFGLKFVCRVIHWII
ncbi:hypothetical protein EGX90_02150 [Gardnerella vaginalis]|nr:hypothetical protein EGX90_02150 [Gardnerella vaginalis]PNL25510.1 hypothetical protein CEP75_002135 [Gardnerella vaginalis]PTE03509.1 hypothetical protein C6Y65_05485 [Gardnerella vaginalis]